MQTHGDAAALRDVLAGSDLAFMSASRVSVRVPSLVRTVAVASALALEACGGGDHPAAPTAVNPPTAPAASPNTFDIQVRFVGNGATPRLRDAFTRAAARWSQVIVGDMGNTPINAPAGECQRWIPALNQTVNDLVVYVRATNIDGPDKTVAQASPCYVNSETKLPILGFFELDSADVDALVNREVLDDVVLHEMGHVLGIGTMWNYQRSLLSGTGTDDPYFTGSGSRAAFLAIGGSRYGGVPVPVENIGSQGTRDSHWRASLFGNELMQGFAQPGGMPLSSVTIASLGDLGYTVSLAAADRFSLSAALRSASGAITTAAHTSLGNDIVKAPMYEVDRNGARRRITPY